MEKVLSILYAELHCTDNAQYYKLKFDDSLVPSEGKDNSKQRDILEYARKHFNPLYFIRSYPSDKRKIEMSFDL